MPLLIDGHNLIGQMPDMKLSDPDDEAKLIKRLRTYALMERKQITVVFDPNPYDATPRLYPEIQEHGACKVIYAMPGQKADDIIRQMVNTVRDKKGLIVVTSDNAVAKHARVSGIKVQSSLEFAKQMNAQLAERVFAEVDAKPSPTRKENREWAEVFKEPSPAPPAPKPAAPTVSPAEQKRLKRAEQLKKQAQGASAKRLNANTTPTRKFEDEES